jgi:multiple sugar transport system permease protein
MKLKTFLGFVAPSVIAMVVLIALPLVGVVYLALHNSYVKTQVVEVTTEVPLFGGRTQKQVKQVPQPVLDEAGNPVQVSEYVGAANLRAAAAVDRLEAIVAKDRGGESLPERAAQVYREMMNIDFWRALEFTLLYTFVTLPLILVIGFLVAMAVDGLVRSLRGPVIFATLLPFIITPVVGSLSIYWLFLDNAVVSSLLQSLGFGRVYFLEDAWKIRSLIIFYGVWHVTPFAFIVLYAGLQSVPQDSIEAAVVDGASRWERVRYVVIPHLMPLFVLITLIHLMDAYRVFEPVLVFGSNLYANSLQYLTYFVLTVEKNDHKAAAYAILTVIGIVILLIPVLARTWREQKA